MLISPYPKPEFLPPPTHPRLMLRADALPRVRANFSLGRNALAARLFDELLTIPVTGIGATPEYGAYDLGQYLAVEARALRALLDGDAALARTAVDDLFVLIRSFCVTGEQLGFRGNMNARWGGHLIFVAAEVYDWCYAALTAEEKTAVIDACERIAAATFEMGYPPERQGSISGHGSEAQLLRDLLAFSVAVRDERPDIYDFCAGRLYTEYRAQYAGYFGSGAHPQGPSYGSYRLTASYWAELIFRAMGAGSVFGDFEPTADWMHSMTRPDGEAIRLGDDFFETKDEQTRKHPFAVPFFFLYALTGRADLRGAAYAGLGRGYLLPDHRGMDYYVGGAWGEGLISPTAVLIFDRFSPDRPAGETAAARYFGFPVGMTVVRHGPLSVLMKIGELWNANHDHLDTGSFQIFCGAPLLTEAGVYDSYGTAHRKNFLISTSAHNCLTVRRPDRETFGEQKPDVAYDGGVRRARGGKEPKWMEEWTENYRMAAVTAHREDAHGAMIAGDLTEAYCHTCASVTRTMEVCFDLPPADAAPGETARLTVTDDVTSLDASYEKCFNLRTQTEPTIAGRTAVVENGGARVEITALSPADAVLTAEGGEGRQFLAEGVNYPPREPFAAELGWGAIRVRPGAAREHDVFRVEFRIFGPGTEEKV